jgi:hypothetical protein
MAYSTAQRDEKSIQNYSQKIFGRPRHIWEDNTKIDLQEIGCECVDWIIWLRSVSTAGS